MDRMHIRILWLFRLADNSIHRNIYCGLGGKYCGVGFETPNLEF